MKLSELFVAALKQGLSAVETLHCLPDYEPHYIHRVPVEVHRAALQEGWRFFPVSFSEHLCRYACETFSRQRTIHSS